MLAIGRILRTGAKMLLLDEPTEGLAPVIVQQIGRTIHEIKNRGFTVLLVEQNFRFAQTVADRHYVVERGRVIDMIPNHGSRQAWTSCTSIWGYRRFGPLPRLSPAPIMPPPHENGLGVNTLLIREPTSPAEDSRNAR